MEDRSDLLTIGQLARRVGLRPSTLRYYESQALLAPQARSPAGYRLYSPAAEHALRFIQRAQRLGFSLDEIKTLLHGWQEKDLDRSLVIETAEERHRTLEREITELMTRKHELEHFLQDLRAAARTTQAEAHSLFDRFVERVCANPFGRATPDTVLDWLNRGAGAQLGRHASAAIIARLRGLHVHIWQDNDAYQILVVDRSVAVKAALLQLAALPNVPGVVNETDEGWLFQVKGPQAYMFARLFLALEAAGPNPDTPGSGP